MKALVLTDYKHLEVQDIPIPRCASDQVMIRIEACGICGSDVHGFDGSTGRRRPPMIMGHEAAGTITEVGSQVSGYQPGDRVTFDSTISCGRCHYCLRGQINLCQHRRVIGVSCEEYKSQGAFAEYLTLPPNGLYRLGDQLAFEKACMVEPLSIAFHAVKLSNIQLGQTVLVLGAGTIGQLVVQTVRLVGANRILVVDIDDQRIARACRHGADEGINSNDTDALARIAELTNGRMADIAIEAVGIESTIHLGIDGLKKGGTLTIIGNISPTCPFPLQKIVTRELRILGSCASAGEYDACLSFLEQGRIDVSDMISAVDTLENGQQWFERLYRKEPNLNKVILKPH